MLRLNGPGPAYLTRPVSFTGAEGGTEAVLAGEPSLGDSEPTTSVDLGGQHILVFSFESKPVTLCIQDLRLYSGKATKSQAEGGAVQITGVRDGSETSAAEVRMFRCHIENCTSELGGGAVMVDRGKLLLSQCVLKNNS